MSTKQSIRVEHRRGKDDWETPPELWKSLDWEFNFAADVCATPENTKCGYFYTESDNGLEQDWMDFSTYSQNGLRGRLTWPYEVTLWCNPPYSEWQKWVAKASQEAAKGCTVVMLLPARTDTKAFHQYIWEKPGVEVRFIKGRVKFVGAENGAPFPSMIVVFRSTKDMIIPLTGTVGTNDWIAMKKDTIWIDG